MIDFKLPSLGSDMDEGKLLEWKVAPGQKVAKGDIIAVVDTTKAAVDVESWDEGTIYELLTEPGETIAVGTVMARLLAPGESAPAQAGKKRGAEAKAEPKDKGEKKGAKAEAEPIDKGAEEARSRARPKPKSPAKEPAVEAPARAARDTTTALPAAPASSARRASPVARRRAAELGIDLDEVTGSGPGGAITLQDVVVLAPDGAGKTAPAAAKAGRAAKAAAPAETESKTRDRSAAMRGAIAAAMSRSKREIPHYYLSEFVPMSAALDWLRDFNEARPVTGRVLPAALLLKAVALSLAKVPELNGHFVDGEFRLAAKAHVGVAISLRQGGLIAPALHDVAAKGVDQLMNELADLVRRTRAGSLRSSEMSDPTITVTNLGDAGVESVIGVIYPPQVALVGFGRIATRPAVIDGKLVALPALTATLAADHRVSDGHRGGLFLAELRDLLQKPDALAGSTR